MSQTWILVANSTLAKIFHAKNNHDLQEVYQTSHPESRMPAHELVTDRQGRGHESNTHGRFALAPQTTPKQNEFNTFAREISKYLDSALKEGKFNKLYIAASPHFLGLLRDILPSSITRLVAGEIDKDITTQDTKKVREHFPEVI